ncbi:uncharacterized protein BDZ99DRAFT_179077 [Mytilinidion resinicola]|uniref:Uncharacterized protein n=1 Tax=Mytilinidion resinicola TaxID=574789 RepID=A0A6A6Y2H5_9PEZI|nr:uncharacterized protein BDZ99DRAFT_179077 [Mytilinidion resinicola]KAF2803011.1 hypothetical protein BDZ99DRAFT_179077 [Mytilinidion resinicola]
MTAEDFVEWFFILWHCSTPKGGKSLNYHRITDNFDIGNRRRRGIATLVWPKPSRVPMRRSTLFASSSEVPAGLSSSLGPWPALPWRERRWRRLLLQEFRLLLAQPRPSDGHWRHRLRRKQHLHPRRLHLHRPSPRCRPIRGEDLAKARLPQ